jgi:hypothetical protein
MYIRFMNPYDILPRNHTQAILDIFSSNYVGNWNNAALAYLDSHPELLELVKGALMEPSVFCYGLEYLYARGVELT